MTISLEVFSDYLLNTEVREATSTFTITLKNPCETATMEDYTPFTEVIETSQLVIKESVTSVSTL